MFILAVGDYVTYLTGAYPEFATITAVHNYPYGIRYDAVLDSGVTVSSWDGVPC